MDGLGFLFVILIVVCILSGPASLIIALIALSRTSRFTYQQQRPSPAAPQIPRTFAVPGPHPSEADKPLRIVPEPRPEPVTAAPKGPVATFEPHKIKEALELRMGTKWILVAGIITVIVGVAFFLKYAYDNALIGPLGRVLIAAACGLFALFTGELARRRDYEIVAKGTTALGFAILYAAVFAAYRYYGLIGSLPAFALAVAVTAVAMIYAVVLNEVLIAFLSLFGGFVTPVIVSSGENLPMSLFGYVLVLGLGAMFCRYYRKWRAISWLCFIGTFSLYTGWFEKFFRDTLSHDPPEQMAVALGWLSVFFVVYLIMPVLYEIVRKVDARKEDVALILVNAFVAFYYLWTVLFDRHRTQLALAVAALGAIHIVLMLVVAYRCPRDSNLRIALLALGLLFITIALPLYWKMYALSVGWAAQAFILTVAGIRYRSRTTSALGIVAAALGIGNLFYRLPMHTCPFTLCFNIPFGTWAFVAAVLLVVHLLYRYSDFPESDSRKTIPQFFYALGILLLFLAAALQWYWHCKYNTPAGISMTYLIRGLMLLAPACWLFLIIRPLCPKGNLVKVAACALAVVTVPYTILSLPYIYHEYFYIFANTNFAVSLVVVLCLFLAAALLARRIVADSDTLFAGVFVLSGIFLLWVLLTEQIYLYWYCKDLYLAPLDNWQFIANMNISVMWALYAAALMVFGFWRRMKLPRYIALGLFALLLVKVFLYDTRTVKSIYRITAFLVTGVTMLCVSYLYQFLKKKGFFEALLAKTDPYR